MTERTAEYRVHKAPSEGPARRLLEGAPRQPAAEEAWKDFTLRLAAALAALEDDLRTLRRWRRSLGEAGGRKSPVHASIP